MTAAQTLQARTAFTCILGVVAGQFLAAARVTQDGNFPVLAWLAYTVTCGMVLHSKSITRVQLALAASASPTCMIATIIFLIFQRGHAYITGVEIKFVDREAVLALNVVLWLVSYVGIWLFSFAHAYILWLVKRILALSDEMLARVDVRLKWAAGVVTSLAFLARQFMS